MADGSRFLPPMSSSNTIREVPVCYTILFPKVLMIILLFFPRFLALIPRSGPVQIGPFFATACLFFISFSFLSLSKSLCAFFYKIG